jgi:hypothetical protein
VYTLIKIAKSVPTEQNGIISLVESWGGGFKRAGASAESGIFLVKKNGFTGCWNGKNLQMKVTLMLQKLWKSFLEEEMGILSVSKRWEILKGKYIEDEQ